MDGWLSRMSIIVCPGVVSVRELGVGLVVVPAARVDAVVG